MKTLLPLSLLCIALGSGSPGQAQQLRSPQMDVSHEVKLPQLTQQASLIVEGRPTAFRSFWNREHTSIYTATTIEVYRVFKGEVTGSNVELITYGGWVGETGMSSTTNVKLDEHTVGLFFLKPSQQPSEGSTLASNQVGELAYGQQGFIRYSGDQAEQYAAFSKFRVYPDVEKSLYVLLQQETGKVYRTKKAFDVTRYDQVQERLTGVNAATKTLPAAPIDTKKS
ncbi:hypothetical protein [Hymenobacter elongatus]|uniref:DUF4468 domain-containing protein n=1 Tax=Hymenobacter elongatus TaxID=877208 RepID=A0A4Z0PH62_9BACT|nr:hypothetical protein [Hymenobacter elongatus]TGE14538.1 hypothetical protein E5J99_15875 [Hymenobacter elongatus]